MLVHKYGACQTDIDAMFRRQTVLNVATGLANAGRHADAKELLVPLLKEANSEDDVHIVAKAKALLKKIDAFEDPIRKALKE